MDSNYYIQQEGTIVIPIEGGAASLELTCDDLRGSVDDIIGILKAELVPLQYWLNVALGYIAAGHPEHFESVMKTAVQDFSFEQVERSDPLMLLRLQCVLGIYYIRKADLETDRVQQPKYIATAREYARHAEKLQARNNLRERDQYVYLLQAMLLLTEGKSKEAFAQLEMGMQLETAAGELSVMCHVAGAGLLLQQKKYPIALGLYKHVLERLGSDACLDEIRLAIAYCQLQLGRPERARLVYERVLQRQPRNAQARYCLAMLHLQRRGSQQAVAEAVRHLTEAYELAPHDPHIALLLSSLALLRGENETCFHLARQAGRVSQARGVNADLYTNMGRACHASNRFKLAGAWYNQGIKDGRVPLAQVGSAQVQVRSGLLSNALTNLEQVLQQQPAQPDALLLLAKLQVSHPGRVHRALTKAREVLIKTCNDPDLLTLLVDSTTRGGQEGTELLPVVDRAIQLYRAQGKRDREDGLTRGPQSPVPVEVLSNAAYLHFRADNRQRAAELITEAKAQLQYPPHPQLYHDESSRDPPPSRFEQEFQHQLRFNYARIMEGVGRVVVARATYEQLLQEDPRFVAALLGMAQLTGHRGAYREADEWCDKLLHVDPTNVGASSIKAQVLQALGRQAEVSSVWSKLSKLEAGGGEDESSVSNKQAAGILGLGNLHLANLANTDRRHVLTDENKRRKYLVSWKSAIGAFREVLQRQPNNPAAFHGLACVLAEEGQVDTAAEIFRHCLEAFAVAGRPGKLAHVHVNLAHTMLAKEDYGGAIAKYEYVLNKYYHNNNAQVLLYLAKAYYDARRMGEARRAMQRALHVNPGDTTLLFNMAFTLQQEVMLGLKQLQMEKMDSALVSLLEGWKRSINQANALFRKLRSMDPSQSNIESAKLVIHSDFCQREFAKVKELLLSARSSVEQQEAAEQHYRAEMARRKQDKQAQKELEQRRLRDAQERQQALLRSFQERKSKVAEEWRAAEERARQEEEEASRRPKKRAEGDGFIDNAEVEQGDKPPPDLDDVEMDRQQWKAAGLLDSDEEKAGGRNEGNPREQNPSGKKPKLKRQRNEPASQPAPPTDQFTGGPTDELEDEAFGDEERVAERPAQRQKVAILDDDEDEEEGDNEEPYGGDYEAGQEDDLVGDSPQDHGQEEWREEGGVDLFDDD